MPAKIIKIKTGNSLFVSKKYINGKASNNLDIVIILGIFAISFRKAFFFDKFNFINNCTLQSKEILFVNKIR